MQRHLLIGVIRVVNRTNVGRWVELGNNLFSLIAQFGYNLIRRIQKSRRVKAEPTQKLHR